MRANNPVPMTEEQAAERQLVTVGKGKPSLPGADLAVMKKIFIALVVFLSSFPAFAGFGLGPRGSVGVLAASCTGGTHTSSGANTVITFLASGTLTCSGSFAAQILVVGGGGGASGAGGGAGGYCATDPVSPTCGLVSSVTIPSGSTSVTVGAGGAGTSSQAGPATAGSNSSLGSIVTALGGGPGGGTNANNTVGGGSGGGAGPNATGPTPATGGVGSQGSNGGANPHSALPFPGSGGGGAGAVGQAATPNTTAGNGGDGLANSISGTAIFYAGGGGGGFNDGGTGFTFGAGGLGGGGAGGSPPSAGAPNTGGGGGANFAGSVGGAGGSGIIIVSCATSACGS
jgi:hypothetical protein